MSKTHYDDAIRAAINKWVQAKGVDPEHVFTANDWSEPKYAQFRSDVSVFSRKPPLSLVVKGQINTSVFEEAIIVE
jgi:hypothetical protein